MTGHKSPLKLNSDRGGRCQKCGLQCVKPGENILSRVYMLQVHHWNRDPRDNRRENLIAQREG